MKSIRNIALSALLTFSAFTAVVYTSCNKDECKDVVCQNGGTCADGICTCAAGYEGTRCEIASATKFLGNYDVSEQCSISGNVGPYSATISQSSTSAVTILLQNFGDFQATITVSGTVNGNTLTIPQQTVSGYTVSGSGTYNNGVISIPYTVSGVVNSESCTATWTKK